MGKLAAILAGVIIHNSYIVQKLALGHLNIRSSKQMFCFIYQAFVTMVITVKYKFYVICRFKVSEKRFENLFQLIL